MGPLSVAIFGLVPEILGNFTRNLWYVGLFGFGLKLIS